MPSVRPLLDQQIARLAGALPKRPTDDQIEPLARALAERALLARKSARMSASKGAERVLHGRPGELLARVRSRSHAILAELAPRPSEQQPLPAARLPLKQAAYRLGLGEEELLRRLVWPQWRRMHHWPRCEDGDREWWFHLDAFTTKAPPDEEAYHILPPRCLRAEQVHMDRAPGPSSLRDRGAAA